MSRRAEAAVLLALGLSGCAATLETKTHLDLDCGGVKLRFEERSFSDVAHTSWDQLLLVEKGGSWAEVDRFNHRGVMSGFVRLLPPALAYRGFPFDESSQI